MRGDVVVTVVVVTAVAVRSIGVVAMPASECFVADEAGLGAVVVSIATSPTIDDVLVSNATVLVVVGDSVTTKVEVVLLWSATTTS